MRKSFGRGRPGAVPATLALVALTLLVAALAWGAERAWAAAFQPDGAVRGVLQHGGFMGDDLINHSGRGQTARLAGAVGTSPTVLFQIQNDGEQPDVETLEGSCSGPSRVTARFRAGRNITSEVEAGTYVPPGVAAPGESYIVELHLRISSEARPGSIKKCTLNVHSQHAPGLYDTVAAKLKVKRRV